MSGLLEFLAQAVIVAVAGALFIGLTALFFDAVIPRISPKKPDRVMGGEVGRAFEKDEGFDILLNSGQWIENVRYEKIVHLNADEEWPHRVFAVMRDGIGQKVLVRLDSVRVMQGVRAPAHDGRLPEDRTP